MARTRGARIGLLLLGLALSAGAAAGDADSLERAVRLFDRDLPALAFEHLRAVDAAALTDEEIPILADAYLEAVRLGEPDGHALRRLLGRVPEPRLAAEPAYRRARAWWFAALGRPGDALLVWSRALDDFPRLRPALFAEMLDMVAKLDPVILGADPRIQKGLLREIVDRAMDREALRSNLGLLHSLAAMERRLDPEGPQARDWVERAILAEGGAPPGLLLQGRLELALGRPDLALPWMVWAAYGTPYRDPEFSARWLELGRVYDRLDWRRARQAAVDRAGEQPPPERFSRSRLRTG